MKTPRDHAKEMAAFAFNTAMWLLKPPANEEARSKWLDDMVDEFELQIAETIGERLNESNKDGSLMQQLKGERDELRTALHQAAMDIMNLSAFLRLVGNHAIADIGAKMEERARNLRNASDPLREVET